MKKILVFGVIMVVLVPWQAQSGEKEQLAMAAVLETETEQIGLEWGQLLAHKVLKKFEAATGETF